MFKKRSFRIVPVILAAVAMTAAVGAAAPRMYPSLSMDKITRERAIRMVIEKIAQPSEAPYGMRVHLYPAALPIGTVIVPYDMWIKGEREWIVCRKECLFFWLDDDPLAQFAHKTRYVLVDLTSGELTVKEAKWWPVVDNSVWLAKTEERASEKHLVFEKPSRLNLRLDWKHSFKDLKPQALPGCEAWVILVCGSDDVGNTFDEDVRFLYNVFTGLGYADNHIFYVSPWTTDPGVDRTTTIANVQWAINQVAVNSDAEDKVFFFYSSHGDVDYLHCRPGSPGGGNVTSTDMDNWLDTITCREMTILLQGCHTGSFIGYYSTGTVVAAEDELTGDGETNRIAITATDTNHSSYGGSSTWGSTFTGGYVASFSDATADVNTSGSISVDEAYTYALAHDSAATAGWSFPHMDPTALDPEDVFHVCPPVDVWISDGPNDSGNNSYDYDSTDIWSSLIPTGTSHEDPISGLTNYVHVVVHNLGSSPVNNVNMTLYWADTSTALAWPASFTQVGLTYTAGNILPGGHTEHTWPWYVDPAFGVGHHFCFVATADCLQDPMSGGPPGYTYVAPYDNNIAQKNITIATTQAGQSVHVNFFISNIMRKPIPFDLVIKRADFPEGQLAVFLPGDLMKILMENRSLLSGLDLLERKEEGRIGFLVTAKDQAFIRGIRLEPMERRMASIEITPPGTAKAGQESRIRIEEVVEGEVVGANTFLVRIVPRGDCPSTLKKALEVYAQIGHRHGSKAALKLVKMIREALMEDICRDPKALLRWKRSTFKLEAETGNELRKRLPEKILSPYFEALRLLDRAIRGGDVEKVMTAQGEVVAAGMKLVEE